ncbi:hypothetical protein OHA45_31085 [Streptomyces lydicus]|nr:hypothetical protein [Streptomyces lydicus]
MRQRWQLTGVIGARDEKHGAPATRRIAVFVANDASEQPGCGPAAVRS